MFIYMNVHMYVAVVFQEKIFSPTGVSVVGVLYPTLESVRAVLSDGGDDDTRWLQYWIAQVSIIVITKEILGLCEQSI